jgi:hypothetical protein
MANEPQIVEFNGTEYEFPAEMSDAQIEQALKGQKPETPSGWKKGFEDAFVGAKQILMKGAGSDPEKIKAADEKIKQLEQDYQLARKLSGETGFDWDRLGGNLFNPVTLATTAASGGLGTFLNLGKLGTAALVGGTTSALEPVTKGDFATEKAKQVGIGTVAGPLGEKVVGGVGSMLKPAVGKAEELLRSSGITPTLGQTLGGKYKSFEQFLENLPFAGSVRTAQDKATKQFNTAIYNRSLNKLDAKLPENVTGFDAFKYVNDTISNKYDEVLDKVNFSLDVKTMANINQSIKKGTLLPDQETKVNQAVNAIIYKHFPSVRTALAKSTEPIVEIRDSITNIIKNKPKDYGNVFETVDGRTYKGIESDFQKEINDYLSSSITDDRKVGAALKDVLGSIKSNLNKQNPTENSNLRKIDSAYRDLFSINKAINLSGNSGIFTPTNYRNAVKRTATGSKTYASGKALNQDIAIAGEEVLTAPAGSMAEGRQTGILASLFSPKIALPAGLVTGTVYSPTGQKVTDALLRQRPEIVKKFGALLQEYSPYLGALVGKDTIEEYNRSEQQK